MTDKIMTDTEWAGLSAVSRAKINVMGMEFDRLTARVAELEERHDDLQTVLTRLREAEVEPTKLWQRENGHDSGFFPGFTELFQWMTARMAELEAKITAYENDLPLQKCADENARLRAALAKYADHRNWNAEDDTTKEYLFCTSDGYGDGWEIAEAALKGGK